MRHKDCINPLRVYSHIAPQAGRKNYEIDQRRAMVRRAALRRTILRRTSYHRSNVPNSSATKFTADLFVAGAGA